MTAPDLEQRINAFIDRYTPDIAAQLREARTALRSRFPRGFELVFDNYNALVFGIGPTEKSSQSFLSIAAYPRWITLFFLHGVDLDDPSKLLQGDGSQVRSIRLGCAADLQQPGVQSLIARAVEPHAESLSAAPPLTTVIKMVAPKQRPRRPSDPAPKGAASKPVA